MDIWKAAEEYSKEIYASYPKEYRDDNGYPNFDQADIHNAFVDGVNY